MSSSLQRLRRKNRKVRGGSILMWRVPAHVLQAHPGLAGPSRNLLFVTESEEED